ncbi:hypothetical protein Pcinc_010021 [Petrolisthes cinctipes]|uniref:Uncharacterized protein n=1 Tax=Petrolisthes cinctipes TaxID=88211 RepID=A0AAE1KU39_PETCI|nr:hypothetical protein Pcinc_010021 [Petrolisthes cinctipes]
MSVSSLHLQLQVVGESSGISQFRCRSDSPRPSEVQEAFIRRESMVSSVPSRQHSTIPELLTSTSKVVVSTSSLCNVSTLDSSYSQPGCHNRCILYTESTGWGLQSSDGRQAQGLWTPTQSAFHINAKELIGSLIFLQCFTKIQNTPILFRMDNQIAIQCIWHQGSSHSLLLLSISEELFDLAAANHLHLTASYLPGRDNVWADALSHQRASSVELELRDEALWTWWISSAVLKYTFLFCIPITVFLSSWLAPRERRREVQMHFGDSSVRQYQSCWKTFQSFLQDEIIQEISQDVVLRFLCHLFHDKHRTLATIQTHESALKAPLFYGCNLTLDPRWSDWLHRSFFLQRPPRHRPRQFWSLSKVLNSLALPQFPVSPSKDQLFRKALILKALASGMKASQLHAFSRHSAWTVFATNDALVSLAPVPLFLAKNEREGHSLLPFTIPAWFEEGLYHPLCPVAALRSYLHSTKAAPWDNLFVWPHSLSKCSRVHIAQELCRVIESADPGKCPKGHDVCKMAASLPFLRSHSLDTTRQGGQWSSASTFIRCYLATQVDDVPCVE